MATIIELKIAPRPAAASVLAAMAAGQSAEIVFFPGIRYERNDDAPDAQPKTAKRRDTLDLENGMLE